MKFILNKDTLEVDEVVVGNSGSVNYYEAEVEYDESWNNLNIEAIIVKKDDDVGTSIAVINNKFFIDKKLYGSYCIGFVGYTIENDKKTYQISSNLLKLYFEKGAGEIETEDEELPTPTEWEIYIAQIKKLISGITSIPSGGTTGQALVKKSDADNDFEWKTIQGGGTGSGAVNSVNGKTGDVNLNAEDVGALPNTTKVPTKTSDLQNDSGFITGYTETDPTVPSHVKSITQANITNWNNKSDFSGNYNDLTNKPTIPDVSDFITKNVNDLTYYTLKTNTGSLIDLEINQTTYVVTLSLKDQDGNVISTDTIDLPLENVVVSGSYDSTNKKIVLTLQSGNTVDIPVGALISGLQSEITSSNKLASDLVDDSNSGNKFVTISEKTTWNGKQNTISDLSTIRSGASAGATAVQPNDLSPVATSGSYNDLSNKPKEVTEDTITNWGFTKNTGNYSKPNDGIPESDFSNSVKQKLNNIIFVTFTNADGKILCSLDYSMLLQAYNAGKLIIGKYADIFLDFVGCPDGELLYFYGFVDNNRYQITIDSSNNCNLTNTFFVLENEVVKLSGTQAIDGDKSFVKPVIVPTPVNDNHATNKKYVDNLIGDVETILATLTTGSGV